MSQTFVAVQRVIISSRKLSLQIYILPRVFLEEIFSFETVSRRHVGARMTRLSY